MYNPDKYKYFSDGNGKIVAVSTYAGRTVRGVAKCDPRDEFDEEKGKALAAARCSVRVAKKRHDRALKEWKKALEASKAAYEKVERMEQYFYDSVEDLREEMTNLFNVTLDVSENSEVTQ